MFELVTSQGSHTASDLATSYPRYAKHVRTAVTSSDAASLAQLLLAQPYRIRQVFLGEQPASTPSQAGWYARSSGSTGPATWNRLPSAVIGLSFKTPRKERWGLLYDPTRISGLLVIKHAIERQARLYAPAADASLAAKLDFLADCAITHLSATPTQWRFILASRTMLNLTQVSVSGEVADQFLLDRLAERFPKARISVVYATTQSGPLLTSHDGQAGFVLKGSDPLRLQEGRVLVRTARGWKPNGDLGAFRHGRLYIAGRADDRVNVAGVLVDLEGLSCHLRTLPGILDAKVQARKSSVAGHVLTAQVVSTLPDAADLVKQRVFDVLGFNALAFVTVVDRLDLVNGKAPR